MPLLVLGLLVGCAGPPHVKIAAPPPALTGAQRTQAFEQLRPVGTGVETVTTCNRGCTTSSTSLLLLNSGQEIRYAEDLLPVLPEASPAAAAARDVGTARGKATRMKRIGMLMIGGFFLGSVIAFSNENDTLMIFGVAGALAGIAVFIAAGVKYDGEINEKTKVVFDGYEQNLATRLNVCVNGLAIVPCDEATGPVPAEPDPALRSLRQR